MVCLYCVVYRIAYHLQSPRLPLRPLRCDTCLTTFANPVQTTLYALAVSDIFGCTGEATVHVHVKRVTWLFVPNVISPNGDQINDFLTVYSNNPLTMILSLQIFDRWGELIFSKTHFAPNDPQSEWDGTFRGQLTGPGVFVYKAEVEAEPGEVQTLTGDITIVR